ncbi:leucyl/phenylalanyl-tRNA--protein transferase [Nocardioidaceae bacterium]|nr:leucyl/phenylalanyl-tRNA--protein transferase [Nocardioidaceae bacterium]
MAPVEPEPSRWALPDLRGTAHGRRAGDVVALGADLAPGTLLAAYRAGLFPMRLDEGDFSEMAWWSPVHRGVLPVGDFPVRRSLRQSARDMEVRVDTAFAQVVRACADPPRDGAWIDPDIEEAYNELHRLGWAHSVEVWQHDELVGGLYGIAVGGLFAGESMFHRVRDASKVALWGLVTRLDDEHAERRLLDVQWRTDHLATLGVVEVSREDYLDRLARALDLPLPAAFAGAGSESVLSSRDVRVPGPCS